MFRFHINTPAAYVIGLFVVIVWGITFLNNPRLKARGFLTRCRLSRKQPRFLRPCLPGRPLHHRNI